jgi:hypothetical protein
MGLPPLRRLLRHDRRPKYDSRTGRRAGAGRSDAASTGAEIR